MKHFQTFQVFPAIPKQLSFIEILSRNIWWCWNYDTVELFRRIDPRLWDKAQRNPIVFCTYISQDRWQELARDNSFLSHLQRVKENFIRLVLNPVDQTSSPFGSKETIAYFSMEFGIHESIPIFAGGLGVLAGDHLKAASDMGIPLTGIGLLYRQGYFRQYLNQDGMQQEDYPEIDINHLPLDRVKDSSGEEVIVTVDGPDGKIHAQVWELKVGRVPLYLLDTNLHENSPEIRNISTKLYAGEGKVRLAQEMLMGIGGMRLLKKLGIFPKVVHINEGHCAFVHIERLAQIMSEFHVDLGTAREIVPRTTVFTTHTPVAAGNEEFPAHLVRPYLTPFKETLGISEEEIMSWGRPLGAGPHDPVNMFIFSASMAQYRNGVSWLHGQVARRMWAHLWKDIPQDEVPISHVTNGVHIPSWLSYENAMLFERYIGPNWNQHPSAPDNVSRVDEIYDEELWRSHCMSRSRLIRTCRELISKQYRRRNAPRDVMRDAESVLDQDILTIAFARRFATYKRAYLLFMDPDRLEKIINNETRPVQFIFAGKAHPNDNEAKDLIRQLIQFARRLNVRHRIVFIEDYDIHIARHLVHGADVWLNTPRRPFEACGTSGMKAAVNGVLNVSILDGWWCEGYSENRGWKIGSNEEYTDMSYQDAVESQALYNVLENEVIPCFYDRKNGDIPTRWLGMMKESIKMGMRVFCAHRMLSEYETRFYMPSQHTMQTLLANDAVEARKLSEQNVRLRSHWNSIRIETPTLDVNVPFRVGDHFEVKVIVHLGELRPEEIRIELYYGLLKTMDLLTTSYIEPMEILERRHDGSCLYHCNIVCQLSGRFGFTVRISPLGDEWTRFTPGFITWAG